MVQVQSSWFPLTDRQSQTFTDIPMQNGGLQAGIPNRYSDRGTRLRVEVWCCRIYRLLWTPLIVQGRTMNGAQRGGAGDSVYILS